MLGEDGGTEVEAEPGTPIETGGREEPAKERKEEKREGRRSNSFPGDDE